MIEKPKISKLTIRQTLRGIMNGSILTSDIIRSQLGFIAFLSVLGIIYISNRYHAEKVFRETENVKRQIEELRSEKIIIQSKLMTKSRREEVLQMLRDYESDLEEAKSPAIQVKRRKR